MTNVELNGGIQALLDGKTFGRHVDVSVMDSGARPAVACAWRKYSASRTRRVKASY